MRNRTFVAIATALLAAVWLVHGCAAPPRSDAGGFDSDNPAALQHAIRQAGADRDESAVPRLIELLNHDDPVVRMLAIGALERITGREDRFGYEWQAESPAARRAAIDRWERACREGQLR